MKTRTTFLTWFPAMVACMFFTLAGAACSGGCIQDTDPSDGTGRFPALHGTSVDDGYRLSEFQRAMWNAYRNP